MAIVALGATWSARAAAAGARVVLVRSSETTPLLREASTRLAAELTAAGFTPVDVDVGDGDARAAAEQAEQGEGTAGTVLLRPAASGAAIDVWVGDAVTHKTSVRRVPLAKRARAEAARVIALHALELLRASLLEATSPPKEEEVAPMIAPPPPEVRAFAPPTPPPPPPAPAPESPAAERPAPAVAPRAPSYPFAIEAGAGLLAGFGGVGPAAGPQIALSVRATGAMRARLFALGPAFGGDPTVAAGSAQVRQELAGIEATYALGDAWIAPILAAGAGAYHLHARGIASAPFRTATDDVWSAMIDAGAGLRLRLGPQAAIVADARAVLLFPRPIVVIADAPPPSTGRPSILGTAGVEARF